MLESLGRYYSFVISGRVSKLFSLELFFALAFSAAIICLRLVPSTQSDLVAVPLPELAKALGTYGALGMSTCLTTMALATRWTSSDFNDFYRFSSSRENQLESYSTLLFKLSWTAISHWIALLFGLVVSLAAPANWKLVSSGSDSEYVPLLGAAIVFVFIYCVASFFSVLLQVSTLCMIRKEFADKNSRE